MCQKNFDSDTIIIGTGVHKNNFDSDITNRDRCLQKQLLFRHYKQEQVSSKTSSDSDTIRTGVQKTTLIQTLQIRADGFKKQF
jgi:hypothetical protein